MIIIIIFAIIIIIIFRLLFIVIFVDAKKTPPLRPT